MFLLQLGAEPISRGLSIRGVEDDTPIWEPIISIAVETDDGWVLLETGIGRAALDDGASLDAIYQTERWGGLRPWGLSGDPLQTALATVDLRVEDFSLAVVSHLHVDHSGGIPLLAAAGIPVAIHQRELRYATGQATLADAYYASDYAREDVRWRIIDSELEIAPGIKLLETPGHTPGHLSYRIDLAETGTWIMTIDAADLEENLIRGLPPGCVADPADEDNALRSLQYLISEANRLDARLVPGHDPLFWRAVRHPLGGHR